MQSDVTAGAARSEGLRILSLDQCAEIVIVDSGSTDATPTSAHLGAEAVRNALRENHPNPFSSSTTIAYELKEAGHVTLDVYDAVGRKVRTLVDEVVPAGSHLVEFDGSALSSGVYFYRLSGAGFHMSRAMTLVR